jgi:hypothetical protein
MPIETLVAMTAPAGERPGFTYSDIRTRLVPTAVARAFPERAIEERDLLAAAEEIGPSPVLDVKQKPA